MELQWKVKKKLLFFCVDPQKKYLLLLCVLRGFTEKYLLLSIGGAAESELKKNTVL